MSIAAFLEHVQRVSRLAIDLELCCTMSQRASQMADVQLQGHYVTQYIRNMQQRDETMVQNFKPCRDAIMDAAQLYADEQDTDKLDKLREQLLGVIQKEREIEQHKAALGYLQSSYQPSLDKTDFAEIMQQRMQQIQATDGFNPEADSDVQELDAIAGKEQQQEQEEQMDEDDELMVVGNVEKNERCPYTRKELANLDEPLEDQAGFIYEGEAIRAALRHAQREGCNWIECPLPGVSHAIMLHNLKPANKRRLQRMAKLKQQQGGTQAGHGRVVLDA